jgi:hypothetical protein
MLRMTEHSSQAIVGWSHGTIWGLGLDEQIGVHNIVWWNDVNVHLLHPELPGVVSLRQTQTNPRLHGWDIVSRTNTMDIVELLYSYLAGMNGVAYTNAQWIV